MLRKRTRSAQKDQGQRQMRQLPISHAGSDVLGANPKGNSFFGIPGLLEEGKDIYIYRGEKAFCSLSCRSVEILNDEDLEVCDDEPSKEPLGSNDGKEYFFETGLIADN